MYSTEWEVVKIKTISQSARQPDYQAKNGSSYRKSGYQERVINASNIRNVPGSK